jgi:hypothetical protein
VVSSVGPSASLRRRPAKERMRDDAVVLPTVRATCPKNLGNAWRGIRTTVCRYTLEDGHGEIKQRRDERTKTTTGARRLKGNSRHCWRDWLSRSVEANEAIREIAFIVTDLFRRQRRIAQP